MEQHGDLDVQVLDDEQDSVLLDVFAARSIVDIREPELPTCLIFYGRLERRESSIDESIDLQLSPNLGDRVLYVKTEN